MKDPGLVIHVLLVRVDLICKKLLNEFLHLLQGCELKSLLFSLKQNFAGEKAPEDLQKELCLGVLLCSKNFFQSEEVLFGI